MIRTYAACPSPHRADFRRPLYNAELDAVHKAPPHRRRWSDPNVGPAEPRSSNAFMPTFGRGEQGVRLAQKESTS